MCVCVAIWYFELVYPSSNTYSQYFSPIKVTNITGSFNGMKQEACDEVKDLVNELELQGMKQIVERVEKECVLSKEKNKKKRRN